MKTYLVGGAVRDKLLGLSVVDRDWVVVGETPAAMLDAGFKPVGKDFPVFLHPESHEEYALARTERKTGPGYSGFQFDTDTSVTLEDDLLRRDLTINAIAESHDGTLTDPFNGQQDIIDRVLRHVSAAFAEDPVRVLRIAKFMARFAHLGFDVADSTMTLIHSMVDSGEIDNLVPERVWRELEASLEAHSPSAFFITMQRAHALAPVMDELEQALVRSSAESAANSPDTEPGHACTMLSALDTASSLSANPRIRFAALCAGFTTKHAASLDAFCQRLRVPSGFAELAQLSARFAEQSTLALTLNAEQLHRLLKSLDASRRPDRFKDFLVAAQAYALAQSNSTSVNVTYPQSDHLQACAHAMSSIDAATIAKSEPNKSNISSVIKQHEVAAIENYLSSV